MIKRMLLLGFMLTSGITFCFAGKIDGKWKTTMGGQMELIFTFKVDGDKLTGTATSDMGTMEISNGKVTGDSFTFDIDMNGNAISHSCKLDGEVIKMTVKMPEGMGAPGGDGDGPDGPGEMILKRVE
jgi:hypothetical protein